MQDCVGTSWVRRIHEAAPNEGFITQHCHRTMLFNDQLSKSLYGLVSLNSSVHVFEINHKGCECSPRVARNSVVVGFEIQSQSAITTAFSVIMGAVEQQKIGMSAIPQGDAVPGHQTPECNEGDSPTPAHPD